MIISREVFVDGRNRLVASCKISLSSYSFYNDKILLKVFIVATNCESDPRPFIRVIRRRHSGDTSPHELYRSATFSGATTAQNRVIELLAAGDSNVTYSNGQKNNTRENAGQCALAVVGQWTVTVGSSLARRRRPAQVGGDFAGITRTSHRTFANILRSENDRLLASSCKYDLSGILCGRRSYKYAYICIFFYIYILHITRIIVYSVFNEDYRWDSCATNYENSRYNSNQ